jgi:hypothetical protein
VAQGFSPAAVFYLPAEIRGVGHVEGGQLDGLQLSHDSAGCRRRVAARAAAGGFSLHASQRPSFSSSALGVRVDVLVTDGRNAVGGLTAPDFELRDNGVVPPNGVPSGGFHRLDVRVTRRGLSVKARPGYIGVEPTR